MPHLSWLYIFSHRVEPHCCTCVWGYFEKVHASSCNGCKQLVCILLKASQAQVSESGEVFKTYRLAHGCRTVKLVQQHLL